MRNTTSILLTTILSLIIFTTHDTVLAEVNNQLGSQETDVKAVEISNGQLEKMKEIDQRDDTGGITNFYIKADKMQRLPSVTKLLKRYPHAQINDVNAKGDYVGCLSRNDFDIKQAFANIKGRLYVIGSVAGIYACATGINDKDEVVGYYEYKEGVARGFLWKKNKITKLPLIQANGRAMPQSINNHGIIVGMATTAREDGVGDYGHAVSWVNLKINDLSISQTGEDKNCNWALDVNDYDQVFLDCGKGPILWQNGIHYFVKDLVSGLPEDEHFYIGGDSELGRGFFSDNSLLLAAQKCGFVADQFENGQNAFVCSYRNVKVTIPKEIKS